MSWNIAHSLFSARELEYLEILGERGRAAALRYVVPVSIPVLTPAPVPVLTSVSIGASGEQAVAEALRKQYTTVKPGAHSGDLLIEHRGLQLMIEVKNYSSPVPTAQVDKFHADADALNADLAMLVSLGSPITGHGAFALDSVRRRLLVQCPEARAIVAYVEVLFGLAAVCVADVDAVEGLARKALRSVGRLSTVRAAIHDAERALALADSALALAEAEATYLLSKLAARAHALTSAELVDVDEAAARFSSLCLAHFPGSLLVQPAVLAPLSQKTSALAPYHVAATDRHVTLKNAQGSIVIHPQVRQIKMTLKTARREITAKGYSLADFEDLIQLMTPSSP